MPSEWKAASRALRVAGSASVGALVGAVSISLLVGGAAAQPRNAEAAQDTRPAPPSLLPRDELVRRLRAGEMGPDGARSPTTTARAQRSQALEAFCTHAYRVASFPEALDAIAAETEIPLSSLGDDATAGATASAAAELARFRHGPGTWAELKSRVRLFDVGEDCPSVYASPFAGLQPPDWIVTAMASDGLYDLEFAGPMPRVPRMAFGFYYDAPSQLTRLAVFVSSRDRTLLIERLGLLEGYFKYRLIQARGGWGRIDAGSLETVLGHTWLSEIQHGGSVNQEAVRQALVGRLRQAGTSFVELGGICEVVPGTLCAVDPHRRVGASCNCTFMHREQTGTQEMVSENVFGEVLNRWQEPVYRDVQTVRSGTVVRTQTRQSAPTQ